MFDYPALTQKIPTAFELGKCDKQGNSDSSEDPVQRLGVREDVAPQEDRLVGIDCRLYMHLFGKRIVW
ncbi:unnamed protein product [Cylicocyclus nassatus]|uniref:Uncharacterized protein n=1 Tax=Cylicocyclus nassatus TaxID=53992 RepID=A0AA36M7X3_CYLNA|nr:unnamed protein product [Cylicocyclus nassatus]